VYLLIDPGFLSLPLNFYEETRLFVRPSVRLSLRWELTLTTQQPKNVQ